MTAEGAFRKCLTFAQEISAMALEFPAPESPAGGVPAEQNVRSVADSLIATFLANVNHELQTPLNAILEHF